MPEEENTSKSNLQALNNNTVDAEFRRIADEYIKTEGEVKELDLLTRKEPTAENTEKLHRLQIQLAVLKKMKEEILDKKIAAVMSANNEGGKKIWE